MNSTQSTVEALFIFATVLGPILDIVVWRRRQLGFLIYYFELFPYFLFAMLPNDFGMFEEGLTIMLSFFL